jgi:hypothetical protein
MPPDDTTEVWMTAQQYAQLDAASKKAVSAAIDTYEKAVAAADKIYEDEVSSARKTMMDAIADITEGRIPIT